MSEAPDRGIAIRVGVSGGDDGTMIEMTAVVPETSAEFLLNPMLDRLVLAGKRQRAKAQLPELRHERDGTIEILRENQARLVALDAELDARSQKFAEDIGKVRNAKTDTQAEMIDEWYESGRRGEWNPRGGEEATINRYDQAVANLTALHEKAIAEHHVARSQLENEIKKRQTAILILDRRIEECVRLSRGEDISDVADRGADLLDRRH